MWWVRRESDKRDELESWEACISGIQGVAVGGTENKIIEIVLWVVLGDRIDAEAVCRRNARDREGKQSINLEKIVNRK